MNNFGLYLNKVIASLFLFCAASPVGASQSELAKTIMDAGTSGSEVRRTSVSIDGCTVQTLVFEPFEEQGLVLYSRFEFDLSLVEIVLIDKKNDAYFFPFDAGNLKQFSALFNFRTIKPYKALHEMPNFRIRKNSSGKDPFVRTPSERTGADGYHFIENHDFIFIVDNLPSLNQAKTFIESLRLYQTEYCRPVS